VSLFLLILGFLSLMLGILSEYVGLIYEEVKGRPNFIVARTVPENMRNSHEQK